MSCDTLPTLSLDDNFETWRNKHACNVRRCKPSHSHSKSLTNTLRVEMGFIALVGHALVAELFRRRRAKPQGSYAFLFATLFEGRI
jgi:hypothetical protein